MKLKSTCLALFSLLAFATAQAQVKVGANPGSLTTGAVLDVEGSSGARNVIMNDGRVGVNTSAPNTSADLELGSANKALFLNRVANTAAITAPQPGMVIYDLSAGCVKTYQGNPATWTDCLSLVGSVSALNCATARFNPGSATQNQAYSGTLAVPYSGGNGGSYPAQSFTAGDFTLTLSAGYFNRGSGSLVYTVSGTPQTSGVKNFSITAGGQDCNGLSLFVNIVAPNKATGTGTLSGRSCFDIAESNDNTNGCGALSGRTANRANFNQAATYSQTYVFTPTATVSNVRFVYVNTNGQVIQSLTPSANYSGSLSSGSSASAVAMYNQDLSSDVPGSSPTNGLAYGLTSSNPLTADIYVVYNNGSNGAGTDKQLKLTASVKDCACCGVYVAAGVWKQFMCHNLGADYTADPFTPAAPIHGAKYRWGSNGTDLHKEGTGDVTWVTQSYDQNPSNTGTITGTSTKSSPLYVWNNGSETAPIKGDADPCPAGYRVPTESEWRGIVNTSNNTQTRVGTFSTTFTVYDNYGAAFWIGNVGSGLLLPAAGIRDTALSARGNNGQYWTSKAYETAGLEAMYFTYATNPTVTNIYQQSPWSSIRCIAE